MVSLLPTLSPSSQLRRRADARARAGGTRGGGEAGEGWEGRHHRRRAVAPQSKNDAEIQLHLLEMVHKYNRNC